MAPAAPKRKWNAKIMIFPPLIMSDPPCIMISSLRKRKKQMSFIDDFDGYDYNSQERDDDYNVWEERQLDEDRELDMDMAWEGADEDAHLDAQYEDIHESYDYDYGYGDYA